MSYRQSNSSCKDAYLVPQSRLSQQNRRDSTDEGCPVIEESGTVCGETNSLSVFQEFRQMYDDCLKKLEGTVNGNATLKKLAPFKKLIDDLWEQNTMLVETVEELEQEATCRVTNLQDRLNKSCQKMGDYKDDIKSLVKIIHCFCENGVFDPTGLKFKTFCCSSVFGDCGISCPETSGRRVKDLMRSDISFNGTSSSLKSVPEANYEIPQGRRGVQCDFYDNSQVSRTFSSKDRFSNTLKISNSRQPCVKSAPAPHIENTLYNNSSVRSFDQICKFEHNSVQDYQACIPPVNVNFNIGNYDTCENLDCCCDCISNNGTDDC